MSTWARVDRDAVFGAAALTVALDVRDAAWRILGAFSAAETAIGLARAA